MTRSQFIGLLVSPFLIKKLEKKPSEFSLRYAKACYDGKKLNSYEFDEVGQWPSSPCHQGILYQIRNSGKQFTYNSDIIVSDIDRVIKEFEKQL
jgi:hypothetical protein